GERGGGEEGGVEGGGVGGGMVGGRMGGGMMGGGMMGGMSDGKIWTINGVSTTGHIHKPFLTLQRGRSYVLALHNNTFFHHPIHLHGHAFRVLSRNGNPTAHREWRDTV